MKSYYITFIRNGLTDSNLEGKYTGHTDVELSEDGIKQLDMLKTEYEYPYAEALFSSPLKRCTATSEMLYPHLKPIIMDDLIEYNFGEFEGKTADDLKEDALFARWLAGEQDAAPPFGETNENFASRICNCFIKMTDGLMKTGTTHTAIVTHGGVIMSLLSVFGIPEAPMHEWLTPNGCGYTVQITPSIWMSRRKFEVIAEVPAVQDEQDDLSKWDYYPE